MRYSNYIICLPILLIFLLPCPLFAACGRITWEEGDAFGYSNVVVYNSGSQSSYLGYVSDDTTSTAYIHINSYGSSYPGYSDAECTGEVIVLGEAGHWYRSIQSKYQGCRIDIWGYGWCPDGGTHCPDEERAPIEDLPELMSDAKRMITKKCGPVIEIRWRTFPYSGPIHDNENVNFGYVTPRDPPNYKTITIGIHNVGSMDLQISYVQLQQIDPESLRYGYFLLRGEGCSDSDVKPQEHCTQSVVYGPRKGGLHSCRLVIRSNDPENPIKTLYLRGMSVSPAAWFHNLLLESLTASPEN